MAKQITELFRKSTTRIKSIAFHPVQPTMLTGNHCGTIYLWSCHYGQMIRSLSEHVGSVRSVRFHPSGELFVTGGDDKIIRVWNYRSMEVVHRLKGHSDFIRSVAFHPTHPWIISASDDCTVRIWNYYTGDLICSSSGHHHYVMSAIFIDSSRFVTGSLDHTIGLWNCANLFEKSKRFMSPDAVLYQTVDAHDRGINTLFFNNGHLYSGSDDREMKRWRYTGDTLVLENTFYSHEGNVTGVFEADGFCMSVSEDGMLIVRKGRDEERVDVGSRLWSVAAKGEYIAVGSDNGLCVFRHFETRLASGSIGQQTALWFIHDGVLKHLDSTTWKIFGDYPVGRDAQRIQLLSGGQVLVQYSDKYEFVKDNRRVGSDLGLFAESNLCAYRLYEGTLWKDNEVLSDDVAKAAGPEFIVAGPEGVYHVSGQVLRYYSERSEVPLVYNCSFEIKSVVCSSHRIAVLGKNWIVLLSPELLFLDSWHEKTEIISGYFTVTGEIQDLFVYSTARQVKYFYQEPGVLLSTEKPVIPVGIVDSTLVVLGSQGIEKLAVSFGEIMLRKSVAEDGDILSVIKEEKLPGLAPLNYLIKKGKGMVVLPYINDTQSKFEVLMSGNNFEEAYSLCEDEGMFRKLAEAATRGCSVDVAEMCFKRLGDSSGLFFLYLSSGQLEKLRTLEGTEVDSMVKLVLEDASIFKVFGCEQAVSNRMSKLSISANKGYNGNNRNNGNKEYNEQHHNDKQHTSVINKSTNIKSDITDNEASSSTDRTGYATMNDSESHFCVFDSGLLREQELPEQKPETLIEAAMDLTTQKDFKAAVQALRAAIHAIAGQMKTPEDFSELRRKIGIYLWALHAELSRKDVADPAKAIQLALFFAGMPLEARHKAMAEESAAKVCCEHGNEGTAKKLAEKAGCKVLGSQRLEHLPDSDEYVVESGELCYDTLEVEERPHVCSLCFVKSKAGLSCTACIIGLLE